MTSMTCCHGTGNQVNLDRAPPIKLFLHSRLAIHRWQGAYVAMQDWLKKNGLGSYGKAKLRGEFNSYHWDITIPSYLFPFCLKGTSAKPGFIVVDILPQYEIKIEDIRYFIKKFEACRSQYKKGIFFPILLGNSFAPDAFMLGKESGFLITTPINLFGTAVGALISDLKKTLENLSSVINNKSEVELSRMIRNIIKLEGKSNTLRGQLFEMIVGHIVLKQFGGSTYISKSIEDKNGEKAEIDILSIEGDKTIRIIECKGNNSNNIVDMAVIEHWKSKTRVIRNWISENLEYRPREQHFEFWTTSTFSEEALTCLERMKSETKKFRVEYRVFQDIINLSMAQRLSSIGNILKEHYSPY